MPPSSMTSYRRNCYLENQKLAKEKTAA